MGHDIAGIAFKNFDLDSGKLLTLAEIAARDAVGGDVDGHGDLIVRTSSNAGPREVARFMSTGHLRLPAGTLLSNASGDLQWDPAPAHGGDRLAFSAAPAAVGSILTKDDAGAWSGLAVGAHGQVLMALSNDPRGLAWRSPDAVGGSGAVNFVALAPAAALPGAAADEVRVAATPDDLVAVALGRVSYLAPLRQAGDLLLHDGARETRLPAPSNAAVLWSDGAAGVGWTAAPECASLTCGALELGSNGVSLAEARYGGGDTALLDIEMTVAGATVGGTAAVLGDLAGGAGEIAVSVGAGPLLTTLPVPAEPSALHAGGGAGPAWTRRSWLKTFPPAVLDELGADPGAPRLVATLPGPPTARARLSLHAIGGPPVLLQVRQGGAVLYSSNVQPGPVEITLSNVLEEPMEVLASTQAALVVSDMSLRGVT